MPMRFRLPVVSVSGADANNDVWIPVRPPRDEGDRRGRAIYAAYGKLKPGVTIEQARRMRNMLLQESCAKIPPVASPTRLLCLAFAKRS